MAAQLVTRPALLEFKELLKKCVFVEQRELECRSEQRPQRRLATSGQSGEDDERTQSDLTLDMSGDRRHAKHAGGRPFDGRVRCCPVGAPHGHRTDHLSSTTWKF